MLTDSQIQSILQSLCDAQHLLYWSSYEQQILGAYYSVGDDEFVINYIEVSPEKVKLRDHVMFSLGEYTKVNEIKNENTFIGFKYSAINKIPDNIKCYWVRNELSRIIDRKEYITYLRDLKINTLIEK